MNKTPQKPKWMEETKGRIDALQKEHFFDNWSKQKHGKITFYVYPTLNVPGGWFEQRAYIYRINAEKLGVKAPEVAFFAYPSIEVGREIGITPSITFVKERVIHGHIKQSPGHELTHVLLGELNSTDNLPANGLWSEGICVYLDGTETDRKKHALSLNLKKEVLRTPWLEWRKNMPANLYPLAGSIVQYCEQQFGWNKVIEYLREVRKSGANDAEFSMRIFGFPYFELQKKWLGWLEKEAGSGITQPAS
ncbi:MAG: hypothetical protein HZA37_00955 [Parcubacteria group bacterium]|nr:hypothetical protein [Parcubacteria group bacterium]